MLAGPKDGVLRHYEQQCRSRYVDAVLCSMQARTHQSQAMRSHSLRVWLGMVMAMAKVIEFYVPEKFRKQSGKWVPPEQRGKIIPFPAPAALADESGSRMRIRFGDVWNERGMQWRSI
jgi:hypothetical protein